MWTWRELHNTVRYTFNNPFYPASSCLAGLKLTCFHFSCPGKAFEWVNWSFISNFFPSSRWTIEYRVHFSCDFSSPTFINYYISQFFSFLQMNGRVLSALHRLLSIIFCFLLATTGAAVTDLKDQLSCWVEVEICKQCRWMTHWMNTELWKSADERVQNFLSQFYQVLFQVLFFSQFYQLLLTVLSSTFCSQQLLLRVYIWCQSCDRQSCKKLPSCLFFIFTN